VGGHRYPTASMHHAVNWFVSTVIGAMERHSKRTRDLVARCATLKFTRASSEGAFKPSINFFKKPRLALTRLYAKDERLSARNTGV